MSNDTTNGDRLAVYLTTRETLARSGIKSATTLRRLWKAGRFPQPRRIHDSTNGTLMWKAAEVDEWMESRTVEAA